MANVVGFVLLGLTGYAAMETQRAFGLKLGAVVPDWLSFVSAFCFGIFGWFGLGYNAGFGGFRSLVSGLRYMVLALMFTCIVFGVIFIVGQLLRGFYLDPFKTIFDWFRISFDYFIDTFNIPVWSVLVLGALISGRLTGIAAYRWR